VNTELAVLAGTMLWTGFGLTIAAPPEVGAATAPEAGNPRATTSSPASFHIRPIAPRRSAPKPSAPLRELSLRCLRRQKLLETNTDSPPWARHCNSGRLTPAELADGLALWG
jgi:hypothetical protein